MCKFLKAELIFDDNYPATKKKGEYKGMIKCYDHNKTELHVGTAVMFITNGAENEGIVTKLLENNRVEVDGENGIIQVSASDTYETP